MENYRVFSETFHYDRAIEQIPSLASVLNVWGRLKAVPIIEERRIPGTDRWEQVENSRAVAQLNRPNNYQTGSQFIADLITAFILRGEYRILKINSDGQLTTDNPGERGILRPVFPDEITPEAWDPIGRPVIWCYQPTGNARLPPKKVNTDQMVSYMEFENPFNKGRGLSRHRTAAWNMRSDFYGRRHNASISENGGKVEGAFLYPPVVTATELEIFKKSFDSEFAKARRAGGYAHLTAEKFQSINQSNKDMDFLKGMEFTRDELLSLFGVSPEILGYGNTTFANRAAAKRDLWEETLEPWSNDMLQPLAMTLGVTGPNRRLRFKIVETIPAFAENQEAKSRTFLRLVQGGASVESAAALVGLNIEPAEITTQEPGGAEKALMMVPDMVKSALFSMGISAVPAQIHPTEKAESPRLEIPTSGNEPRQPEHSRALAHTRAEYKNTGPAPASDVRFSLWKGLDEETRRHEKRVEKSFKRFITGQRKRLLKGLDDAIRPYVNDQGKAASGLATAQIAQNILDPKEENLLIRKDMSPSINTAIRDAGNMLARDLDFDGEIDYSAALIASTSLLSDINKTTYKEINDAIAKAAEDPEPEEGEEQEKNLADILRRAADAVRGVFTRATRIRSKTIGETESHRGVNVGRQRAAESAGVAEMEWLTERDDRVRESHQELDGRRRPIGESFSDETTLRFPQDPLGSPSETINCRCFLLPVR